MQWVALDGEGKRIIADEATKNAHYLCPECLNVIRMRSGPHRRAHFYHVKKNSNCKQQGKTLCHLETQLAIQKALPFGEATLEAPFPNIRRIADVAWGPKKIIFEVQCSPISREEVVKRTEDYKSLGFDVVWILHERRYNQKRLSSAEDFLSQRSCYFSSIDEKGHGGLYDQFHLFSGPRRLFRGAKIPLDILKPYAMEEIEPHAEWPKEILIRKNLRALGFKGDLVDRIHKSTALEWEGMKRVERRYQKKKLPFLKRLRRTWTFAKGIYSSFLHALLEKHSI